MARQGLVAATAFSAIEQALWDLAGKALDVPSHVLLGGKVRNTLPVYANINRATSPRTPDGFAAAAKRAVADRFRAIKAAPWDGFPPPSSPENAVARAVDSGIAAVAAMREAVGARIAIMVDCHSFFDVERAVRVAERLEPYTLTWYEEPVAPEQVEDTLAIRRRNSSAHGRRRNALRALRVCAPRSPSRRGHHHARREALRRPARIDAHRRDGGR
jgi:galactonate dehydratase